METGTPRTDAAVNAGINTGMTLRDYFAGQAMVGILGDRRYSDVGNEAACAAEIARYAGRIADEMLAERQSAATR